MNMRIRRKRVKKQRVRKVEAVIVDKSNNNRKRLLVKRIQKKDRQRMF